MVKNTLMNAKVNSIKLKSKKYLQRELV